MFEFLSLRNTIPCILRRVFRKILRLVKGSVTNSGGNATNFGALLGQMHPASSALSARSSFTENLIDDVVESVL